jgi:hypothetical protein
MEELIIDLRCPICLELKEHGFCFVPCAHTICKECIYKMEKGSCCMICRSEIKEVIVNRQILDIVPKLKILNGIKDTKSEQINIENKNPIPLASLEINNNINEKKTFIEKFKLLSKLKKILFIISTLLMILFPISLLIIAMLASYVNVLALIFLFIPFGFLIFGILLNNKIM